MPNHHIDIQYVAGNPQASWSLELQSDRIRARKGDTVSFSFSGPDALSDAVMMAGPRRKEIARSPFEGGNQLNIAPDARYKIDQLEGLWGFSVAFTTIGTDGISQFYFLPDPELEVGSNID